MKQLLVLLLLMCSISIFAQDVIVKKDGSTIVCRVVELTATEITYKKWSDLNGSNYVMERSAASAINYQDGKKVNLSEMTNLYQPNNQNDGVQQYNDRALLGLEDAASKPYKKARTLRTIGWIGGGLLVASSIIPFKDAEGAAELELLGAGLIGGGILWWGAFYLLAHNQEKKVDRMLYSNSILNIDFDFKKGYSFSTSIDLLSDRTVGNKTLGIGLRYNF